MSSAIEALRAALGNKVSVGADIPARNHADASGLAPNPPAALVMARSTEDVAAALTICHAHRQPVVTQGGLTGLAGGGQPMAGEVAVSLERMSGIEEVDPASATLTALAGTPLAVVQQAADEAGFLCGIDLGARGTCTIGGNIATNAGGNQVLRYGMTRRNILGLEAVLADGTVVTSLNKMLKNNAGYDWTQLFIGSEGTLGIVTRAVVALHPKPTGQQTALCAVGSFEDALNILRAFQHAQPGRLLVFEAMWREFMTVATRTCGLPAPFEAEHEVVLLIEADLDPDAFAAVLGEFYEQGLVKDAVVAQSRRTGRACGPTANRPTSTAASSAPDPLRRQHPARAHDRRGGAPAPRDPAALARRRGGGVRARGRQQHPRRGGAGGRRRGDPQEHPGRRLRHGVVVQGLGLGRARHRKGTVVGFFVEVVPEQRRLLPFPPPGLQLLKYKNKTATLHRRHRHLHSAPART
jgi:UDP-N-acetylenolpyruvoylglucosamine reductase